MKKLNPDSANESIRINASDGAELKYWARKFKVTRDEIKLAVKEAGDSLTAVEKYLQRERK